MDIFLKYLWVTFFEFTQNFTALLALILYMKNIQDKKPKVAVIWGLGGAMLSSALIALLEGIKISVTSLPAVDPITWSTLIAIIILGAVFYVLIVTMSKYFLNPKTTYKTDVIIGIVSALVLSGVEIAMSLSQGDANLLSVGRIVGHTGAFLIAFPITVIGIRYTLNQKRVGAVFFKTMLVAIVMSLIIAAVDYLPFVK
jgi:hypothetical protein